MVKQITLEKAYEIISQISPVKIGGKKKVLTAGPERKASSG